MGKGQSAQQREQIVALLSKHKGAAMGLGEIALHLGLEPKQVLTLLGQLKGRVECASKATMEEGASMKWSDVDSRWRIVG